MTSQTKAKLQAARAAAAERKRRREDAQAEDFLSWLQLESHAYERMRSRRDMFGPDSQQARDAEVDWKDTLALRPHIPSDAAFRRIRNEEE